MFSGTQPLPLVTPPHGASTTPLSTPSLSLLSYFPARRLGLRQHYASTFRRTPLVQLFFYLRFAWGPNVNC